MGETALTPQVREYLQVLKRAMTYHGDQRYGYRPFAYHLLDVVETLHEFGLSGYPALVKAAILHDTIEDTAADYKMIRAEFGHEVADLVEAVTDEPGPNRKTRKALTYTKTRQLSRAVGLKLCDRIANVRASVNGESDYDVQLFGMYRSEHAQFKELLYRPGEYDRLWNHLEDLLGLVPQKVKNDVYAEMCSASDCAAEHKVGTPCTPIE